MNSMKNKLKIYCLTVAIITAVLTLLRTGALFLSYDTALGYFNSSPVTAIMNALYILGALWAASSLVLLPAGSVECKFIPTEKRHVILSFISGLAFSFSSIFLFASSSSFLDTLFAASALISAFFFAFPYALSNNFPSIRAYLSILSIVAFIGVTASLYFDMTIAMNSPHKIMGSLTLMSAMILMLCETRIFLGKSAARLHFASCLLTFILGTSYSASSLVYLLVTSPSIFIANPILLGNVGHIGIMIGVSIYSAARALTFGDTEKTATAVPEVNESAQGE